MFSESILVCFYSNPSSNSLTAFISITRRSTLSTTLFFTDHPVQHSIILFETNNTLLNSLLLHTLDLLLHCDNASWWFHYCPYATEWSEPYLPHPVLHSPSSEATATVPSLSHSDHDRLIKPFRVGTHRQQNLILSSTLATNEALSTHECMGSSPTSYNDNHMNDSSHSHPNDTPSCEPCPPPHTVHLPSIICNHSLLSSFHCSISGRCLSSLDEQWVYACNTPQSDLDKHSRSHSRCFKRSRFPIQICHLQRQQTVHVHQQLGRNNFRTTPWSSQPYRVHTRSLATNRTDKREGIVNRNISS